MRCCRRQQQTTIARRKRTLPCSAGHLLLLCLLTSLHQFTTFVHARIGPDGKCGIRFFAPFTRRDGEAFIGVRDDKRISVGFSNMAAASLAARHFNSRPRNTTLVPEFANISDCNVTLELLSVYNTQSVPAPSSRLLFEDLVENNRSISRLCAMAGSHHDAVAQAHSVLATTVQVPLIATRSLSLNVVRNSSSPFTTSVFPDSFGSASFLVSCLLHLNRTSYIALLYPLSDTGLQRRAALGVLLDAMNMKWMSSEFLNDFDDEAADVIEAEAVATRTIRRAVETIKETGYRTIILALDTPRESILKIADVFEELGMNNGDYFVIIHDEYRFDILHEPIPSTNVTKLLYGASVVLPISRDFLGDTGMNEDPNPDPDPITLEWPNMGEDFADELNSLNPLKPWENGYLRVNSSFFRSGVLLDYGAAFAYDSMIAIGMGACRAQEEPDGSITGASHQIGVRSSQFFGASGNVKFGSPTLQRAGTRPAHGLTWSLVNLIQEHPKYQVPAYFDPEVDMWQTIVPYIYADGTNNPPKLRADPDQNYLTDEIRIAGLTLMGISMGVAFALGVWVLVCRKHKVLAAAQPVFLFVILSGVLMECASVLTVSFDESHGLTTTTLSRLCMAFPWLLCTGIVVVLSALFTKLWRVHKVLQFSRKRVKMAAVLWPMAIFFGLTFLFLTLWTALDPLYWERHEINSVTGDSVGECRAGDNSLGYIIPLAAVVVIAGALMTYMAWKTKDVDDAYSEASWIFILLLVQGEVLLVAAPVAVRLSGEEPSTSYLAIVGLVLSFPWTTMGLILGPKVWAYYVAVRGLENQQPKRGQRVGGTRVTGLATPERRQETAVTSGLSHDITPVHEDEGGEEDQSLHERREEDTENSGQP